MPIVISHSIIKTFTLEKSDKKYKNEGEPTTVTIRQARQSEHDTRQDIWALTKQIFNNDEPGEVQVVRNMSMAALRRKEVFLSLAGSNLVDESGKLLFPSRENKDGIPVLALTEEQFASAWGRLLPDIAAEIHEKVLEMNPIWSGAEGEEL